MKRAVSLICIFLAEIFSFYSYFPVFVSCHHCCGHLEIHFEGIPHIHLPNCHEVGLNNLPIDQAKESPPVLNHVCFQHEVLLITLGSVELDDHRESLNRSVHSRVMLVNDDDDDFDWELLPEIKHLLKFINFSPLNFQSPVPLLC